MRSGNTYSGASGRRGNNRIMYDARGRRIKSDPLSNKYLRVLLLYILPYLVINGIILLLVCSSPRISVDVKDTDDYISTEVSFTVKSLLPVKELNVALESEPLEYTKSGKTYTCVVDKNGTFTVDAKSLNGMSRSVYTDINLLDDAAPSIDESSINYSRGELSFTIEDTLSGVNYEALYGTTDSGERVDVSSSDSALGSVTMILPTKTAEYIELHYEDMVGNAGTAKVSLSAAGAVTEGSSDNSASSDSSDSSESAAASETSGSASVTESSGSAS